MTSHACLLALVVLAVALAPGSARAQRASRVVGTAADRPVPEPAEQVLRRRGVVVPPTYATRSTTDTNLALAAAYRSAAREIAEGFGRFKVTDGRPEFRRGTKVIETPVRRVAGRIVVLGPERLEGWIEMPPRRVLKAMEEGLLIDGDGIAVVLTDHPAGGTFRRGALVGGWFYGTGETIPLGTDSIAANGAREAMVLTYGEPVIGPEATEAIAQIMDRRRADAEVLIAEAERLEAVARERRAEAVARFRAQRAGNSPPSHGVTETE